MIRLLLVLVFVVVPLVELAVIVQVAEIIQVGPTILLLLAVSLAGAWLVRREGVRAWLRFRTALASGRVPADEVLEGALVLFGGALLLTPGFVTDAVGLLLMVPPVRAVVAGTVRRQLGSRFTVTTLGGGRQPPPRPAPRRDDVVDVEVVNIERTPRAVDGEARGSDINSNGSGQP